VVESPGRPSSESGKGTPVSTSSAAFSFEKGRGGKVPSRRALSPGDGAGKRHELPDLRTRARSFCSKLLFFSQFPGPTVAALLVRLKTCSIELRILSAAQARPARIQGEPWTGLLRRWFSKIFRSGRRGVSHATVFMNVRNRHQAWQTRANANAQRRPQPAGAG